MVGSQPKSITERREESSAVAWVTRQSTGVEIIGVPNPDDGDDADRAAFAEQMSTQVSHVFDDPGALWVEHQVLSQPTTIFVAADGTTEVHTGGLGPQGLLERVQSIASS